ncbi:MAG: DUF1476 domain-containing protein [Rhodobacteraceae bacterium]|nr:DUF1476 domain-containing protein [Paracoccaceae bacterium]
MTTFDDREQAFEKKYAHDAEMQFKAEARRNKKLGLWAAEKMSIAGEAADAYAQEVIASDFEEAGDEDVFRKVAADFAEKGIEVSETELRVKMAELMVLAKGEVMTEAE